MNPFVGRKIELSRLDILQAFNRVCLTVVTGRRRVGKSRLIQEWSQDKRFLSFTGLPPTEDVTAQQQRDEFARQLAIQFNVSQRVYTDWGDVFHHLTAFLTDEPTVLLFDEISWMGGKDHLFVPKLKVWWDLTLQKYARLRLFFCGSVSTWIEKNIIKSTAFFGRITLNIEIDPLSLLESTAVLRATGLKASTYEMFTLMAVTGGVPWYLEQMVLSNTIDENIKRLCFTKKGLLVTEFNHIFHDLFNGNGSIFQKIAHLLADGMKNLGEIKEHCKVIKLLELEDLLEELITAGFVSKHYSWSIKTEKVNEQYLYRLSDNYLRFYLKYIEPNIAKINKNNYQELSLQKLSGWDTIMGLQVENLLLNNRAVLIKALGINFADIVADGPYVQRKSIEQDGCQIDYLVQTATKSLFVCEFKFKRSELGMGIITSMQEKIKRFNVPRGYGIVPVLFHLGGVTEAVDAKRYFYRIIDIADFLES